MLRHRLYLLLAAGLLVAGSLVTPVPVVSDDESEDGKTETEPTPPEIVESVTPEYPPEAFEEGIEGRTVLAVVVDSEGKVTRVGIAESSGREDFDAAAREALVQWKFRPAERDGEPVEMQMLVPIEFALGDRSAHHDEDCDEPHDEHHDEHHDDDAKHHDGHDEHPDEHHDSSGHGHGHHH
jgi:protein TonB